MRNSKAVRSRPPATVRLLLLLMVAIIVGIASLTTLRQQGPRASPQPLVSSTQAASTPNISVNYTPRKYAHSQLSVVRPIQMQRELGRPTVQSQVAAPSLDGFPQVIRVGRTSNPSKCVVPPHNVERVDHVPFKDYVRNVLPYEWYASWPEASLDAGVVAISQYAWVTMLQGKWTQFGYGFDVLDSTCDQVYRDRNPKLDYSRTDAAVERVLGVTLTRNGQLIQTYYRAHAGLCPPLEDCMGQWESRDLALSGWSAEAILRHFYAPLDNWSGAGTDTSQPAPAPAPAPPAASEELINVGRTFDPSNCFPTPSNVQRIDRVSLKDYARNVLPSITNSNWSDAALDGAVVSIIEYVHATKAERKWTRFGHEFDVVDSTCDYPYIDRQPGRDYSRTDAAVARVLP
jgi:peptidoglycan hydrolase-like amidase